VRTSPLVSHTPLEPRYLSLTARCRLASFRPGAMERMGLSYEAVRRVNLGFGLTVALQPRASTLATNINIRNWVALFLKRQYD
jgi:hypothetical protein